MVLGFIHLLYRVFYHNINKILYHYFKRIWFPKILYDFSSIKDMVWYSLKFKISNMLYYFERNIDYLILGKFLSSELGYYAFAYNIMYMPVKRTAYTFNTTLFPAFSKMENDPFRD